MRCVALAALCGGCITPPDPPGCAVRMLSELQSVNDHDPWLSPDHRELVFARMSPQHVLYATTRSDVLAPFDSPKPVLGLAACNDMASPFLSHDGLRLWFVCMGSTLWQAHRSDRTTQFESAAPAPFDLGVKAASLTTDETTMVFEGNDGYLYSVSRDSTNVDFAPASAALIPASIGAERNPSISGDGSTLLFGRCGGAQCGLTSLFRATRSTGFGDAEPIAEVEHLDGTSDESPQLDHDDHTIAFSSNRNGMNELFLACE